MFTRGFGMFAVRIVNRCQFDAIQRNIGGKVCFVEDLSGPHAAHAERFGAHHIVSFRDEIMSNPLSILCSDFCENKKAAVLKLPLLNQLLAPLYCLSPLFQTWDAIRKLAKLIAININERLMVNSPRKP